MNPNEFTLQEIYLDVADNQTLYVHEWGNPKVEPLVYLHGGPGNGCDDGDYKKFDPTVHRVIFFDQRGSGKSTPKNDFKNNTTDKLVEDLEQIRKHFSLDKLILLGSSWGSTLALCYGIKHPDHTKALIIDGVFTNTQAEYDWLEKAKWKTFYPEIWQETLKIIPKQYHQNPFKYFYEKYDDPNTDKKQLLYDYISTEISLLKLDDRYVMPKLDDFDETGPAIELYYMKYRCFIDENYIVDNVAKLSMPVYIIQGRYDMICPPEAAYHLAQKLPNAELIYTINGHLKQHEAKNILTIQLNRALSNA